MKPNLTKSLITPYQNFSNPINIIKIDENRQDFF